VQLKLIKEAHTFEVTRHSGVGKAMTNLHRYVYWPMMQEGVARVYTIRYMYPTVLGKTFPWNFWEAYRQLGRDMTTYLW